MNQIKNKKRITSIDALRGLVMLLMLVDHVRERFFLHMQITDPMTIEATSASLFASRLLAHFCAPIFVFLTGLSAWLYANSKNRAPLAVHTFLLKRGLFLLFLEFTFVNFSWFGTYHTLYLQVIWAIGLSMIALSALAFLPRKIVGLVGLIVVFGHNLLTSISFESNEFGYTLWTILHDRGYLLQSDLLNIKISYPVLPWIGVICLGYATGPLFGKSTTQSDRYSLLTFGSLASLSLLLILRASNIYGETLPWVSYDSTIHTLMSFVNFTKYPPSLDFLLLTLGFGGLLLVVFERWEGKFTQVLSRYGSAPLFFYLLHLYILLFVYKICVLLFGTNKGIYFGVDEVWQFWCIWACLALVLYYPTAQYAQFKKKSNVWWVKYL